MKNVVTINEKKLEAINMLIENFAALLAFATGETIEKADDEIKPPKRKGYTVTTQKIKCEGAAPTREYHYHISITDGKYTADFMNGGRTSIELADFVEGTNQYKSRFWAHHDAPGVLHFMRGFGTKNNELKKQKEEMLQFAKSCLSIPISYADGTFVYSV